MAAPGALAVLVALSTMTSALTPAGQVETALHLPRLDLHAPATVPAAASPHLQQNRVTTTAPQVDVDVTGPSN